jgi:Tfp pilus assembly protein PilN
MATINLAPGTQYAVAARKRRGRLYITAAILAVGLLAVWGALFLMNSSLAAKQAQADSDARNIDLAIASAQNDAKRVVAFESRLTSLQGLLDQHIVWNPVFTDLERLLPPSVVLTSAIFNGTAGTIEFSGTTTDMDQVAQALASLRNQAQHQTLFIDGTVGSVERVETKATPDNPTPSVSYKFSASLTFAPGAIVPKK